MSERPRSGERYHVVTLGCKLNQFDSASIESLLRGSGMQRTSQADRADVIVVNTCTVTSRADQDGRKIARRLRRENPHARIVATGCYAQRDPDALRRMNVFDDVVGLRERDRLPDALGVSECVTAPLASYFADRSRAFLRVQEGCHLSCSYCIIPSVRGPGVSTPAQVVIQQIRRLAASGIREIGLTGVNTGSWGRDFESRAELADLLQQILESGALDGDASNGSTPGASPPLRLRLNSLEPRTVTDRIVEMIRAHPDRIVPHIQIPLQSGCDTVLARMSRNYRTAFYAELIHRVVETVPNICLGADVITGFPGETDAEFERTRRFVEELPLAYLHVFSYSVRPGTRAAEIRKHVQSATIRARTGALREVGHTLARRFRQRMLGKTLPALVLEGDTPDGWSRSLTGNYIEVLVPQGTRKGSVVPVRLKSLDIEGLSVRGEVAA